MKKSQKKYFKYLGIVFGAKLFWTFVEDVCDLQSGSGPNKSPINYSLKKERYYVESLLN